MAANRTRVPGGHAVDVEQRLVVDVGRVGLALEVDVLAEAGERRGVAADVEGRLDPVAGHRALRRRRRRRARWPGRASERREAEHRPTAPTPRTYDVLPPCTAALARRARSASQARASAAKTAPCTSSDCGVADAEQDRAGRAPRSSRATGSRAASQARRTGRWASALPTSPATIPASHGSTSSGPSPSTGGQRGEQVLPAEDRLVGHRGRGCRTRAAMAVSPSERRHSGPPSRKKRTRQMTTGGDRAASRRRGSGGSPAIAITVPSRPTTR